MRIFSDCDGVLAAFDEHCEDLFGAGPRVLGDEELWRRVNEDTHKFWFDMPVKDGGVELMTAMRAAAKRFAAAIPGSPEVPDVLTGCPRDNANPLEVCAFAAAHKPEWVAKHFGADLLVITCFSRDKPKHMINPRDILVDDFIANVKKWQKAGGKTVWYRTAEQAIADLNEKVEYELTRSA
jgi:hypothetical protein